SVGRCLSSFQMTRTGSLNGRVPMGYGFVGPLLVLAVTSATLARADEPREGVEEQAALPQAGGEPALRLGVLLARPVGGEWERIRCDFRIVNGTKKPIQFEDGDPGRGFAGKLMYLRDPAGKIKAFGAHWTTLPQYRPNFWGRPKTFNPGAVVHEQASLE